MEEGRDISEFNGSQLKLFRIDESIKGINQCRHNLDIQQWLFFLQDFDMELESVKKKEEKEELDKDLKDIAELVQQNLQIRNNPRIKNKTVSVELIDSLNGYQKKLLTIFKSSGLEMKLAGDAMSSFGRN
jgi:hypothetical protein